jgi:hypothetical protein
MRECPDDPCASKYTVDMTSFLTRQNTFRLGLWRRLNVALETMIEAQYVVLELLTVGSASCVVSPICIVVVPISSVRSLPTKCICLFISHCMTALYQLIHEVKTFVKKLGEMSQKENGEVKTAPEDVPGIVT